MAMENINMDDVSNHEDDKRQPDIIRTDADTVKELVEMRFLTKKRQIRLRTTPQRLLSRKYRVLIEDKEVHLCFFFFSFLAFTSLHFMVQDNETTIRAGQEPIHENEDTEPEITTTTPFTEKVLKRQNLQPPTIDA